MWRLQKSLAEVIEVLGSYLRDAFQEGSADAVACLPVPRAGFSSFLLFAWWRPLPFLVKNIKFLVIEVVYM
jgi:hypothetical protein